VGAKKSYSTDENGRITQMNYTEKRSDGKTETRHYTRYGEKTGHTVSNNSGHSDHYNRYGRKTS